MKKVWLILLALLVIGVGTVGAQAWTHEAPKDYKITLQKNEYGPGYQYPIKTQKWLFDGQQVKIGDTYELEVTFKPSRDMKDLQIMLVDTTAKANYWTELDNNKPVWEQVMKKDIEVTLKGTYKAVKDATGAGADANAFVFDTQGVTGAVTLTFTKFTVKKL